MLGTDRAHVLREIIMCCREGGTLSVPGVYIDFLDKVPFGALMNKALTLKTGQTHVHRYPQPLLSKIEAGEIDPRSSSPTPSRLKMPPKCTKPSAIKKTAASKSC